MKQEPLYCTGLDNITIYPKKTQDLSIIAGIKFLLNELNLELYCSPRTNRLSFHIFSIRCDKCKTRVFM